MFPYIAYNNVCNICNNNVQDKVPPEGPILLYMRAMRGHCGSSQCIITNKLGRTGQGSCGASYFAVQVCMRRPCGSTLKYKMGRTGQGSCGASYFVVRVCYAMALWIDTKILNGSYRTRFLWSVLFCRTGVLFDAPVDRH